MQWHHARIIAGATRSPCSEHPLLSQIEKLIPDNQVICQSGKPHAFIRVAHAFLEGIAVVHSGGNDAASKKNWHTATHQILAWPPCRPGGLKIQLVSPPFGWARRSRKQQRAACGSSPRTSALSAAHEL